MLFILAVILSVRFAHHKTYSLAIDLAWVQYLHFMQPPPDTLPVVKGVVN